MRHQLIVVVFGSFLLGALASLGLILTAPGSPPIENSGKALVGGPFSLSDQNGKMITDSDFRGKYMLIYFGFTHCPDTCPAELQVMTAALDQLGNKADKVLPIFVTVDPERDTPEVLDRLGRIILRHPGSFRSLICGEV
jgi:protein SCO1